MSYFLFAGIIALAFGIFIFNYENSLVLAMLGSIMSFLIVSIMFPLYGETINIGEIKDSLVIVISKGVESDNLDEEIERIIRDEVDDRFFDVSINIETSNVDKLDIKRINIEAKTPTITKYINEKYNYSFKVFIDKNNMEEFNEDCIKIVGI